MPRLLLLLLLLQLVQLVLVVLMQPTPRQLTPSQQDPREPWQQLLPGRLRHRPHHRRQSRKLELLHLNRKVPRQLPRHHLPACWRVASPPSRPQQWWQHHQQWFPWCLRSIAPSVVLGPLYRRSATNPRRWTQTPSRIRQLRRPHLLLPRRLHAPRKMSALPI